MHNPKAARRVAAVALCWVPAAVIAASWFALHEELPAEMATQWSGTKTSGHTPPVVVFAVLVAIALVAALSASFVRRRRAVFLAGGLGAMAGCVWLVLAIVSTAQPSDVGGWGLLTPLAFAYGFVPFAVIGPDAAADDAAGDAHPEDGMADVSADRSDSAVGPDSLDESGRPHSPVRVEDVVVSPVSAIAAAALIVVGGVWGGAAVAAGGGMAWASLVLVLCGLVVAQFALLRVRFDGRCFSVRGTLPWFPFYSVDRERIDDIEATRVSPSDWWGWGYRLGERGTGLIARQGPGLMVRHEGRTLTVNVQRPHLFISALR